MDNSKTEEFMDVETVLIPTDEGDKEYAILDYFNYNAKKYVIVSPIEGDVIGDEVELFRYKEQGEKITLDVIEDKKLYNKIAEAYNNA